MIGLWNNRESSSSEGPPPTDTLSIRENASRRISFREPKTSTATISLRPDDSSGSRFRKTSEIVRPTFSIYEERDKYPKVGKLDERCDAAATATGATPTFSFTSEKVVSASSSELPKPILLPKLDLVGRRDSSELLTISVPSRDLSRSTSDIRDDVVTAPVKPEPVAISRVAASSSGSGAGPRRGSVGLGRSKSVKCNRVKFGLIPMEDDDDDKEGRRIPLPLSKVVKCLKK